MLWQTCLIPLCRSSGYQDPPKCAEIPESEDKCPNLVGPTLLYRKSSVEALTLVTGVPYQRESRISCMIRM